ncbi:hypothetical protein SESBI_18274 [Sesbania bispinosa]|nr:hypothetical protein SESBI_18274 [Sesbania bispinosa]
MMHRSCSGSQGHVMGPCTCGMFHTHSQTNSLSMLFSMPNHKPYEYDESDMYSFTPSSSSVDCTLSLGTPSTRFTEDEEKRNRHERRSSLCNACGIRFKKEERRASAAAATPAAASGGVMESSQMYSHNHNNSWYAQPQSQKMQCFSPAMGNEFRFMDDADRESENGIPFLSWRRTSLVHDYTR